MSHLGRESEFATNLHAVKTAAAEDWQKASVLERAKFAGSAALLTLHEFGMETALIFTAGQVAEASGNNAIAMGAATAALSFVVERTLTHGVADSLESFVPTMDEVRDRYFGNAALASKEIPSKVKSLKNALDVGTTALTLGSPGVMLQDYTKHPEKDHDAILATGKKASWGLTAFNGMWPPVLTGVGWGLEKLGVDAGSNVAIDVIKSPYTLAGLLATFVTLRVSNSISGRRARRQAQAELTE